MCSCKETAAFVRTVWAARPAVKVEAFRTAALDEAQRLVVQPVPRPDEVMERWHLGDLYAESGQT